jgi:hypothetical protein
MNTRTTRNLYEASLQRIISKKEPGEPQKTEYQRVDKNQFKKDMAVWKQRSRTAFAQDRLKKKGAVPTKNGKKMFEQFIREATAASGKLNLRQVDIDDAELKNIYNAASQLDYKRWLIWILDEYK